MSQHLQDQRIKTIYVARQASCCAEPVTEEGKKSFPQGTAVTHTSALLNSLFTRSDPAFGFLRG